ncbi:MAG: arsenate reductase (glutaredoxin) [Robiginitalea sp.]|jgi:arsenate reductase
MIRIYHNPRCRKSREALELIRKSGQPHEIVEYLKQPLSSGELKELLGKLQLEPMQLVRRNEAVWKENYKNRDLSDVEILEAMESHPKLMERPVVVKGNKAVLGRPPEAITGLWEDV